MTERFHEAISSLHLQSPQQQQHNRSSVSHSAISHAPVSAASSSQDLGRSYDSVSSVDSSYTRRGQTESEADIKAGLAAARDLATRKKRLEVSQLSSSPRPREQALRPLAEDGRDDELGEDLDSVASGSKTPLPDTSQSAKAHLFCHSSTS